MWTCILEPNHLISTRGLTEGFGVRWTWWALCDKRLRDGMHGANGCTRQMSITVPLSRFRPARLRCGSNFPRNVRLFARLEDGLETQPRVFLRICLTFS